MARIPLRYALLGIPCVLLLAVGLGAWALATGSSEAQQGAMHNCPSAGKWAISVWEGPNATAPSDALALCGPDAIDAAYSLDVGTGAWSRWFAGKPDVSNLPPLDDAQGVLALGSSTAAATSEQPLAAAQASNELQHCASPGKWSIAVWDGAAGTEPAEALATCGSGAITAAYSLDPQTGAWSRWFAGEPDVSNLPPLDDMQGIIALGSGYVSAHVSAAEGGTVAVPGGPSLTMPAHALSADTTVTIAVALSDGATPALAEWMRSAGQAVQIDLGGAQLTGEASLVIPYDQSLLPSGAASDSVFVAYFDETANTWSAVQGQLDAGAHTLTVQTGHTSWWKPWTWSDAWIEAWKLSIHAVLSLDPLQIGKTATTYWGCVDGASSVYWDDREARNLISGDCVLRDDLDHPEVRIRNARVFILEVWGDEINSIQSTLGKTFLGPSDRKSFTIDFSNAWGGDFETVVGAYTCSAFLAQVARMALLALPFGSLVPVDELAKIASRLEEDPNIAAALQDCQGGDLVNALEKVGAAFLTAGFAGTLQEALHESENDVLRGMLENVPGAVLKETLEACLPVVKAVSLASLAIELADIVSMGEDWQGTVKFTSNKVMRPRTVIPTPTPTSTPTLSLCPVNNAVFCQTLLAVDASLKAADVSGVLSYLTFEPQTCVAWTDPLMQIAPWVARVSACEEEIPNFWELCLPGTSLPAACTIETTAVHMCACGMTNSNFRFLSSGQYARHVLNGATVTAVAETLPLRGIPTGPFIILDADSPPIPGQWGWSDMPDRWALQVDGSSGKIVQTLAFNVGPLYWFDSDTSIPWP